MSDLKPLPDRQFLDVDVDVDALDVQLGELARLFSHRRQLAAVAARKAKQRGNLVRARHMEAVARAWGQAFDHLYRLAGFPF